ncbi:hypothetical protein NDN17_15455 [Shewanella algae]|uniref:hypothetical protein n=1 Tax=Shewanella algae TaxID=38313 RepID=UPI00118462D5|nr:hypothetical protein [Shewanella algae]MCM2529897.1 hypothetical protein [Shewanella algae]
MAYENKKKAIFEDRLKAGSLPTSLREAQQRIDALLSQIQRLEAENAALLEQFKVWQYNAYCAGLNEYQLNQALPEIDRGNDN